MAEDVEQVTWQEEGDGSEAIEGPGVQTIEQENALAPDVLDRLDVVLLEELGQDEAEELFGGAAAARDLKLSRYFRLREFHCRDGTPVPRAAIPALTRLCQRYLDPLRESFGVGHVTSGYRTAAYNRRVGGVANSLHIYDRNPSAVAADVIFTRGRPADWAQRANRLLGNSGGLGRYSSFIHVDNRSSRARWTG